MRKKKEFGTDKLGLRLLLLLAALWILFLVIRQAVNRRLSARKGRLRPPVDTVSCAHCGIHIPKKEALVRKNQYFCCEDHVRRNKREE